MFLMIKIKGLLPPSSDSRRAAKLNMIPSFQDHRCHEEESSQTRRADFFEGALNWPVEEQRTVGPLGNGQRMKRPNPRDPWPLFLVASKGGSYSGKLSWGPCRRVQGAEIQRYKIPWRTWTEEYQLDSPSSSRIAIKYS